MNAGPSNREIRHNCPGRPVGGAMLVISRVRACIEMAVVVASLRLLTAAPTGNELLTSLREGDTVAAGRLIRSGAFVNATDGFGTSALMYAAIYADVPTM